MRPVNLLPASERPRVAAQAPPNASIAVLAVLGLLLIAVAGWVFTKNQVNDKRTAIATAEQEKAQADQAAQGLKAFGDFSQIKQTRVQAVTNLATKRFDWERLMRELALVLPDKVWVSDVTGGDAPGEGAAAPAPAPDQATAAAGAGSQTVTIKACAPNQKGVAATIVRLRTLYGAQEVDLKDSAKADAGGTTSSSSGSGGEGCGRFYGFTAAVTFAPPSKSGTGKSVRAPSRLGGGA
jgi:Tfp pilus assembly protein PilN